MSNNGQNILFLIALLIFSYCPNVSAQEKSGALKFDVLTVEPDSSYSETERIVRERVGRFVAEGKRQPGKIKHLIHYRALVRDENNYSHTSYAWATTAKQAVAQNGDERDVVVLDGGVRKNETLEFWFVPRGELLPIATPEFERSEAIDCPRVTARQSGLNFDKTEPVVVKADPIREGADAYNWTVSTGKIIGRNGWSTVEVDVEGVTGNRLTVFLEVEGLPAPCRNRTTVIAELGNTSRLRDSFGLLSNGDIKARLDAFFQEIETHPGTHGFIYIYGGRDGRRRDYAGRERLLRNQIMFRNFDRNRITIVDGGYREEVSTEFWLVPADVSPPTPTPTVDRKFVDVPIPRRSGRRKWPPGVSS